MSWARIDDAFDDHPKVLAVLEHEQGGAAIGLWTLCLTWAYRNTLKRGKAPGKLPAHLPRRYLGPAARELAALLVKEDLWEALGEGEGWQIHDFEEYLATPKTREARAEAGKRGAAARWAGHSRKPAGRDGKLSSDGGTLPKDDDKGMAPDSKSDSRTASRRGSGTKAAGVTPSDGKLPPSDDNLPSGLPFEDGKPVASDGSRAPAHRAIPNGIAPETRDPSPGPEGQNLTAAQTRRKATRIPDDFAVTPEMVAWAKKRVPHVDGRTETEKFENHWRSKGGRDACKLDWALTWKNWMLNAAERTGKARQQSPPPGSGDSRRPEFMDRR
jgi:hypothetical protein